MHLSFSAVNENADENKTPFWADKRKRKSPAYITELSYGSDAKIIFWLNANGTFGTKTKNKTKIKSFSPETRKSENDQIAHFRRRKRKRISVSF